VVDGEAVGHVRHEFAQHLSAFGDVFRVSTDRVRLAQSLHSYADRTRAVAAVLGELERQGVIDASRHEPFPVTTAFGSPALFEIERTAVPYFGLRAFGLHMNGYVRRADGMHLWIGRRSWTRPICPGMLDNTVAGGQPVGLTLMENLIKECGEEASIPPELARQAAPVGCISYLLEWPQGLKPDAMFCYDLELPADFTPVSQDGEIEEFFLWPVERAGEIVRDTREFKFNCNLVIIDFLIRHGLLPPEHPDYVEICRRLRQ
jgi:8-oxo-dGTP pyrophosphatase MutT (NUDIX family)